MNSVNKPDYSLLSVLRQCVPYITDKVLVSQILSLSAHFESIEREYYEKGATGELCSIKPTHGFCGAISKKKMNGLYGGTFRRVGTTLRPIYDAIKMATKNGICPLCNQRDVSTLDHYLPSAHFPCYSVAPINLIPACSNCNKIKSNKYSTIPEKQTFHPYFDDFDDAQWLFAEVIEEYPPALIFSPEPPSFWPQIKQDRVREHFRVFCLGKLYTAHASVELSGRRKKLEMLADCGGSRLVRDFLIEEEISERFAAKNSWQAAMYQALCTSVWFYSGGFMDK